jgi:HK97 family phage prohead protease
MPTEMRSFFKSELRAAADDVLALEGRAVTYGALSTPIQNFRERVMRGAFTKALADKSQNIVADFNHDMNAIPLGTTKAGTLTLTDGTDGLDFRCVLDPNNSDHRNLYSSVRRHDVSECSWAFNIDGVDGEDWDTAQDEEGRSFTRRTVKRAKLFGISVVCHPAYPGVTHVDARTAVSAAFGPQGEPLLATLPRVKLQINEDALLRALAAKQANDIAMTLRCNPLIAMALRNHCSVERLEDAELRLKWRKQAKELMTDEEN